MVFKFMMRIIYSIELQATIMKSDDLSQSAPTREFHMRIIPDEDDKEKEEDDHEIRATASLLVSS
jgi:hypothetical protein